MVDAGKPGDERFFRRAGPYSIGMVATLLGVEAEQPDRLLSGVAPLQTAGPDDVSFLDNRRYAGMLAETRAGAVILHPDFVEKLPEGCVALAMAEPYVGWAKVSALFFPSPVPVACVHPSAMIDPSAIIDPSAEIGPGVVIGAGAEIGAGTSIGPLTYIAPGVVIGKNCRIHAQVTVSHAIMGNHVVIYPGARIGQDGFGFAISKAGFTPVPQLGRVLISDGVEIGANTTIDRGSAQDTVIGQGVHIDNLVQIGHNVNIGPFSVVVAQAGVSGSTQIGQGVMIAAQAGLAGHLKIGDKARIGAQSGVMQDVPPGEEVLGAPAQNARNFFREVVTLRKLAQTGRKGQTQGPDKE
ncbi:MAG: UDP-3-O-(3-hydroxymyristoyl)glucosamine N-acyltransferase [Rhodospirillales bacterium]|nr:UDP-3-O-(3-hydroxymyristoyl)glucosamine N-acyltransferase [Rhodospirillales bacterium]